ncbi:DUF3175 domain-containing protein [Steroidobacter sp. S1-65]|uniref:DUF3175 domain-containing protein n=2 Tax=Steroidobacter gossypii TaxID=2805490 RepID=A0ABS1WXV2_9GAMM|nr:DUF3175 domain-containing protein [Steroidobacter gossypii]
MATARKHRWSQRVTETSDALTLEKGVFTRSSARSIAASLMRSAERSHKRKSSPYRSAMSMLTFYENRAGKTLPASSRRKLEAAKEELRNLYGKSSAQTSSAKASSTSARQASSKARRRTGAHRTSSKARGKTTTRRTSSKARRNATAPTSARARRKTIARRPRRKTNGARTQK